MPKKRPLTDLSEAELHEWLRAKAQTVEFSYEDCYAEIQRKSQEKHAKAVRSLTFVTAAVAVISLAVSFFQLIQ